MSALEGLDLVVGIFALPYACSANAACCYKSNVVCVSVYLLATSVRHTKQLNRSRCCLGYMDSDGLNEPCIRWRPGSPSRNCNLGHILASCRVP